MNHLTQDKQENSREKLISESHTMSVLDSKYIILQNIFNNGKNKIQLALCKETQQMYAIKILSSKSSMLDKVLLEKEGNYLSMIHDKHVIKVIEKKFSGKKYKKSYSVPKSCNYLVLEYARKGELFDYIKLNSGLFFKIARYFFRQIINGLEVLHKNNICHRDIKIDNLLLDENFNLKFSDFEFCEEIKNSKGEYIYHTDKLGTLYYMAPEFFSMRMHPILNYFKIFHTGDKIDIFASGVFLFVMLTGIYPFHSAEKIDSHYRHFYQRKPELFWNDIKFRNVNENVPDSAKDLLNRMLDCDPEKRITLKEIKEHEFFKYEIPNQNEVYVYMNNIWLMINDSKKNEK